MGGLYLPGSLFCRHTRPLQAFGIRVTPALKSRREYAAMDSPPVSIQAPSDADLGFARGVQLGDVVDIEIRSAVRTHVYNLQTATGMYVANGIVTHNCRCFLAPEIPEAESREPVTVAA